ncbi:hypothetical protein EJ05DRAFT_186970 [Pseudovirgaria hyperparasitica]|uniref:Mediator of RNA polymerase II transcription subunit 16 n=1 Tax=Pseudovirgaria hyperparasitica TaxID=470096 RepID=A0A6A6WG88_9PEZI|nr:uncharacterized protein EJ05DRAFT_186970 [Pseudovirgaria hyperparasitica]KAF2761852.1 hypothetical protein EJ05DRAFT_186970 [Pseudovirgaria hyperparasitica]
MPLIMEDDQYMEDLFNETESIQPAPPHPPLKGLVRRLDELHTRGCCRKIEWAANGCVASISKDGRTFRTQAFARSPTDGKWSLQDENQPPFPPLNEDVQLVHVSWGPIGQDLAILDSSGRIMIFNTRAALGRMQLSRTPNGEVEDELGSIVGMSWLPIFPHQQKVRFISSAARSGNSWQLHSKDHHWNAPHNCVENKAALVCLTKLGNLRLLFQHPDGSWDEVTTELGTEQTAKDIFSHAAFALHDGILLLAAYNIAGRLNLYRIQIRWGSVPPRPQSSHEPLRNMQPPILDVTPVLAEDDFVPYGPGNEDELLQTSHRMAIPGQLTHLEFLKPAPETDNQDVDPTIFAIFSNNPTFMSPMDQGQSHQNPTSIVCRWALEENYKNELHSSFTQLPVVKKKSAEPENIMRLKRLADILTSATVLAFMPLSYNTVVALYHSDGSIDFRNTTSMQSITAEYNTDHVSSLMQAGFAFPLQSSALHIALSASVCVAATMNSDMEVKTKTMEFLHGSLDATGDDSKIEAAMAALALQHTSSSSQYFSSDDILSLVPHDLPASRVNYLLHLLYRGMHMNTDCTNVPPSDSISMSIGRAPGFVKSLSAQVILGCHSNNHRSLAATLANATLNIRQSSIVLLIVMSMHRRKQPGSQQSGQTPLDPLMANGLVGIAKWMVDYTIFLWSELWITSRHFLDNELTVSSLQAYMTSRNSPALLTLLCSLPRALLREWLRTLPWMQRCALSYTHPKYNAQPQIRHAIQDLADAFSDRPQILPVIDALLNDVETAVKKAYAGANTTDAQQRQAIEQNMFVTGEVPEVLLPAIRDVLMNTFAVEGGRAEKVDLADVLFRDFAWLGLGKSDATRGRAAVLDVLRKVPIPAKKGVQMRRCSRGCAYAADLTTQELQQMHALWYFQVSKTCVCGSAWTVVEHPDLEGKK